MIEAALDPDEQLLAVAGLCCAPDAASAFASLLSMLCGRAPVVAVTNRRVAVAVPVVRGSGSLGSWPLSDLDGAVQVFAYRESTPFAPQAYVMRIATRDRHRQECHELRGVDRAELERLASVLTIARAGAGPVESAGRQHALTESVSSAALTND
jgi:hypothetical protein